MNVFVTNKNTKLCAIDHCDKHVVKMNIEYPQLLSTAHRLLDGDEYIGTSKTGRKARRWRHPEFEDQLYKASHIQHPSAVWTRQSDQHYMWLYQLWCDLLDEYTHRYGKKHLSGEKLRDILATPPKNIPKTPWVDPPPAMKAYPQCIVEGNIVESYRNYYRVAKRDFAKWTKRQTPEWYQYGC